MITINVREGVLKNWLLSNRGASSYWGTLLTTKTILACTILKESFTRLFDCFLMKLTKSICHRKKVWCFSQGKYHTVCI